MDWPPVSPFSYMDLEVQHSFRLEAIPLHPFNHNSDNKEPRISTFHVN